MNALSGLLTMLSDSDKTRDELLSDLADLRRENAKLRSMKAVDKSGRDEIVAGSSEEYYRAILEHQVQFVDRYLPGGILTYVNRALAEYVGMRPEDLIGKSFYPFLHKDDLAVLVSKLQDLTLEEPFVKSKNRVILPDGSVRWHQWVHQAFFDESGNVLEYQSVGEDITDRKWTEDELLKSEQRYRTLFDTLTEGFCTIEMIFGTDGKAVNYKFLEVNPAFERQTGLYNARGKSVLDLVPDNEAYWFDIYGKVASTGEPARIENASALNRYYDVSAFRVGGQESRKVAILFNDVTARKLGEASLRDSEERLRLAQDAAKAGTWEWHLKSNKNIWSDELWQLYGLEPHSVTPSYDAWRDTVHRDDLPTVERIISNAASKGIEFEAEWRVRKNAAAEQWVMSRGRPLRSENGTVERYIESVHKL